nr:MAG TPA: peptidase [Caudoviricetes sp.]
MSIHVLSCFRSEAVNRAVGGSRTSAHRFGSAADIDAAGISNLQLAKDIIEMRDAGEITFDQLIYEFPERGESGWIHFGCRHHSAERNEIRTATKRGSKDGKTHYPLGLHP